MSKCIVLSLLALVGMACLSCRSPGTDQPAPKAELTEAELENLLTQIEDWHDASTNYSVNGWIALEQAARVIQRSTPRSVEKTLQNHQIIGTTNGEWAATGTLRTKQLRSDSKLFLLMRVVFELPEVDLGDPIFAKWVRSNAELDPAWPIRWNGGRPFLASGLKGLQGIRARYRAAAEYRYFIKRYHFRDLTSVAR